jgi:hypothetical protein
MTSSSFRLISLPAPSLLLLLVLGGCGGESGDTEGGGAGGSSPSSGGSSGTAPSELVTRLLACPELSVSSDPAASECLIGTYEGKTVGGDDCTLVLGSNGAYEFTSPLLSHDRAPLDDTTFVYDYTKVLDTHLLAWAVNDPLSSGTFYELGFQAKFGSQIPEGDRKIQFDLTRYTEGTTTSVTCTLDL